MPDVHLQPRSASSPPSQEGKALALPVLSVVVPVLNEARTLPRMLGQFQVPPAKTLLDNGQLELIVADGGSSDGSPAIAEGLGAKVVHNPGPQTIGSNRNTGAAAAKGQLLVFCDADTQFENLPGFVQQVEAVFADPGVVGAMPRIRVFPDQRNTADRVFHRVYNGAIRWSFRTPMPFGSGQCQVVRRSAFEAVGGYPDQQVHGEDSTLFRRLHGQGSLSYLTKSTIWESPRRYRHYGYARYLGIAAGSLIGQQLLGRNVLKEWRRVG